MKKNYHKLNKEKLNRNDWLNLLLLVIMVFFLIAIVYKCAELSIDNRNKILSELQQKKLILEKNITDPQNIR